MTLYFAWAEEHMPFSPEIHCRNDIDIFDLTLDEKEEEFATARLSVRAGDIPPTRRRAFISWSNGKEPPMLLFQGFTQPMPLQINEKHALLELIGKPEDFQNQLESIPLKHHPLFIASSSASPQNDSQLSSLYCDRRTLELTRSDWFCGTHTETLEGNHFQGTLQVRKMSNPLRKVTIHLEIQWIQKVRGLANVGDEIATQFPDRQMTSYSELHMDRKALQPGKRLGRSGYWVVRSNLNHIRSSTEDGSPAPLHHYDWELWIGWSYQQKRVETIELTVPHIGITEGDDKVLTLRLNTPHPTMKVHPWLPGVVYFPSSKVWDNGDIYECCTQHMSQTSLNLDLGCWIRQSESGHPIEVSEASLVQSEQGKELIEHARDIAFWYLAKSARCIKITFQGSWEDLCHLTTDMSLKLVDPTLLNGHAVGKVTRVCLRACGQTGKRWVDVTLTAAVGQGCHSPEERPSYIFEGPDSSTEGLSSPPQRLLQHIRVLNGPQRQQELLNRLDPTATDTHTQDILQKAPTRIQMRFSDLRSRNELRQAYRVTIPGGWSAPAHSI